MTERDDANDETRRPTAWSIRIGRLRGVPIDLHVTFLVLLAWIALSPVLRGQSLEDGVEAAAMVAAVFAIVVLHELGHAAMARRFGFETTRILLLPIGGVATLPRMPTRPVEELLVAVAGPLVNLALAAVLGTFLFFYQHALGFTGAVLTSGPLLLKLFWINLGLAAFNAIPAFPMDGGRALRALLAMALPRARATAIAARVGQTIALILGIVGLVLQPMLALIALFVWGAARAESMTEAVHAALRGLAVESAMRRRVDVLDADTPLSRVAEHILADVPHDFVVERGGRLVGILTRGDVVRGLARGHLDAPIAALMHRDVIRTTRTELLEELLPRLSASGLDEAVVLDGDDVVGIVTAESIGELVMIRRETTRRSGTGALPPPAAAPPSSA